MGAETPRWARAARAGPWLALLGAALLALASFLALPREVSGAPPPRPALRAVVVDASASVTRTRPAWSGWVRRRLDESAREAAARGEDLLVLELAAEVRAVHGPGPPAPFLDRLRGRDSAPWRPGEELDDLATDLAGALAAAQGPLLDPERAAGRLELLGDGRSTGADPAPLLGRLAAAGVEIVLEPPPAPEAPDLALLRLDVPAAIEEGARPSARIHWRLTRPAGSPATDILWRIEFAGEALERREPLPAPGERDTPDEPSGTLALDLDPPPAGRHTLRVRAELHGPGGALRDPVPENDALAATVEVSGSLAVLAVAPRERLPELAAWLDRLEPQARAGLDLALLEPAELPEHLDAADVVLTFDLGPAVLPAELCASFVRAGGALATFAGWGFFRGFEPWEALAEDDFQRLLPLRPPASDADPRDVVLVVDGSGSMAGAPFEEVRQAAAELVLGAHPRDRIQMRFFSGALGEPELDLPRGTPVAERRARLARLFAARVPGGSTNILYSLRSLAQERAEGEVPCLALLLTDGRSEASGLDPAQVRGSLAAARTDLRILPLGSKAERGLLRALLLPGEELVEVEGEGELAEILHREISGERVREGDLRAFAVAPGELAVAADLARALEPSFAGGLSLDRAARAEVVPGAEVVLRGAQGEPWLALHRVGAALVASCATTPLGGWASFLEERPELVAVLARALGREERPAAPRLGARGGELVLENVPDEWPARVEARLVLPPPARAPGSAGRELARVELAPSALPAGGDPREARRAPLPWEVERLPAGTVLEAHLGRSGQTLGSLGVVAPGPGELDPAGVASVAAWRPPAVLVPRAAAPLRRDGHPAGPWLLAAGLASLFAAALRDLLGRAPGQAAGRSRRQ